MELIINISIDIIEYYRYSAVVKVVEVMKTSGKHDVVRMGKVRIECLKAFGWTGVNTDVYSC